MRKGIGIGLPLPVSLRKKPGVGDPVSIFGTGANDLQQWCRSDLGLAVSGSNFVSWADQSGKGNNYDTTSASIPQVTASDATLGNRPTIAFVRGSSQFIKSGLNLPATATRATYGFAIIKSTAWNSGNQVLNGDSGDTHIVAQGNLASPDMRLLQSSGGGTNNGVALSTWEMIEFLFNNSTTDFLNRAGLISTGVNTGSLGAVTGRRIGGRTVFWTGSIAEIGYVGRVPTDTERVNLFTYLGGGL